MEMLERIKSYLISGGLFNPEFAEHDKVRDLIIDCREELLELIDQRTEFKEHIAELERDLAAAQATISRMREVAGKLDGIKSWMDFADVFNALSQHMDATNWTIKGLEAFPDLTGFDRQETDMTLIPVEYVKQSGCGDYGYHGTIYFPTTYPNGDGGVLHIRVEYAD